MPPETAGVSGRSAATLGVAAVTIVLIAGCMSQSEPRYEPLADYEQVEPATSVAPLNPELSIDADPVQVKQGAYLVSLLGCGTCHTDGALIGEPDLSRRLAGSRIGIAYSNPLQNENPGVVFPANLTPDPDTGIGQWTRADIATAILHGRDPSGRQQVGVMPWRSYAGLTQDDLQAITAYLVSLPPVRNAVPDNVAVGQISEAPFVHFGVYRSKALR